MTSLPPEVRTLYPYQGKYLDLEGVNYHFLDEGEGPAMLMVHGNPTWSFYYRSLIEAFRGNHRVIVPDHIGCGLSDKPQNYSYRLARHTDNLERLILDLDLNDITLVVHDWGGPIGLGTAVRHPQRFSRLVITNTAAFTSDFMPFLLKICRLPLLGELLIRGLNAFAGLAPLIAVGGRPLQGAVRRGYVCPYDSWANRIATHRFVADIPTEPSHPSFAALLELEQGLARLAHLPVQIYWGEKDWVFTPRFIPRFLDFFPAAQVHRFSDVGHLVVEEAHGRMIPRLRDFVGV